MTIMVNYTMYNIISFSDVEVLRLFVCTFEDMLILIMDIAELQFRANLWFVFPYL